MTTVKIIENGPALIEGELVVITSDKEEVSNIQKQKIAICRCGKSKNGIYCDGSHKSSTDKNTES